MTTEPLQDKAVALEKFVEEHMISSSGVVYTHLNTDTNRPWQERDWLPHYEFLEIPDTRPWDVLNFENCGMVTGAYLAAQSYKYQVTRGAETLQQAARTFDGLVHIFNLGRQKEPGFFPKIYGDRYTEQTSSDQYLYAMKGMRIYHGIAPAPHRRAIEDMVGAMADFWMKRKYRYGYYTLTDMLWPLGRFPSFMIMAHALTGDRKYLEEFQRLHREHRVHLRPADSILADRAAQPGFSAYENQMGNRYLLGALEECATMGIMSLDECLQHSRDHREEWLQSMRALWQEGLLALAPGGLSYRHVLYDPSDQTTAPLPKAEYEPETGESGAETLRWSFFGWRGNLLTPRSVMLARAALNVERWLPEEGAFALGWQILSAIRMEDMREGIDFDGRQLHPNHHFLAKSVCGDALANWLWAYWEASARTA